MKKVNKIVLFPFLRLFILALFSTLFIMVMQTFIMFLDQFIGKGLGIITYLELGSYIAGMMLPDSIPLAILIASIVSLANLGENLELTALKSAGISMIRILLPLFTFSILLGIAAFISNCYFIPKISVNAISLFYDLKHKKPALSIKEGVFYDGFPGYCIKIGRKDSDQKTLYDIMIYDHTRKNIPPALIIAESGIIDTTTDEEKIDVDLFNGHNYVDLPNEREDEKENSSQKKIVYDFVRSDFKTQKIIVDLKSLKISRTKKELFERLKKAENIDQLNFDISKMKAKKQKLIDNMVDEFNNRFMQVINKKTLNASEIIEMSNTFKSVLEFKKEILQRNGNKENHLNTVENITQSEPKLDSDKVSKANIVVSSVIESVKNFRNKLSTYAKEYVDLTDEIISYEMEKYKRLTLAVTCITVMLIGAPLGAIIRKGGLGVPLIIALMLVVIHYVIDITAEKLTKLGYMHVLAGVWAGNLVIIPLGLFLLRLAYKDTRILEGDTYIIAIEKVKNFFSRKFKGRVGKKI